MKVIIAAGVFLLCFLVFIIGMFTPDTTEATILSWMANRAEDSKRAAVMNSIEMQLAQVEIEELEQQIAVYEATCPSEPSQPVLGGLLGWLPGF
ncbi:MAG: hypothetical protein ACR2Q4_14450 [Geminicoccaceae bacterium]